jgi:GNAT superfamily N-acetyltransferase
METRPLLEHEREEVLGILERRWGGRAVVARGEAIELAGLPGIVALDEEGGLAGILTYRLGEGSLEVVTLDALVEGRGAGTALVDAVREVARDANAWRIFLVTTNDNVRALSFYLHRGFRLVTVHQNAVTWSRQVKPSIPLAGEGGIAIEDEVELEIVTGGEGPPPLRARR